MELFEIELFDPLIVSKKMMFNWIFRDTSQTL